MHRGDSRTPSTQTQAVAKPVEAPAKGPTTIDPQLFKLVSGGAPKGGWLSVQLTAAAPKGGW